MQEVVRRIHARFKQVRWMKLDELARYWAAKELTTVEPTSSGLRLKAPFACSDFTLRWRTPRALAGLREVSNWQAIEPGTWRRDGDSVAGGGGVPGRSARGLRGPLIDRPIDR